ncbi:hypothetical protein [Aliirhizobium cellulosilyticum]|uniref:Uncharacterized protein n=1 Tax=Aliirhizobium cellulosilyticum TaxID=393664 RepID=A0A7W6XDN6_9HYPH|nr:hypothetical protein [Rhizobium cellulosilyticum]MBB4351175.1 hypothetical protein [Rhizobium cellulosilyticum]MBB4414249.1 hypothetical protein [Rhizobium cellulosilyticum]MBB4448865.1 hypothetical protein [Rhizobium cellulosilyticum]
MTDRKVVENATDARQGMTGKPVLIVLCAGLCLAAVAWVGAEFWGEATDAPAQQTATPPAGHNTPKSGASPSETTTPPNSVDRTPHAQSGTVGSSQSNAPSGDTTKP